MITDIFTKDSYRLITRVTEGGVAKDMTGATVVAKASNGAAGTVDLSQAASGMIGAFWPANTFASGQHEIQVQATQGGDTRTIAREYVRVEPSLT